MGLIELAEWVFIPVAIIVCVARDSETLLGAFLVVCVYWAGLYLFVDRHPDQKEETSKP